jgi:hydroxymethylpyrimidine pyrophosphatase-like HAD family hydrolase
MPKIGLRNIKTALAILITLLFYLLIHVINPEVASLWYSPFFAGIAAAYSLQSDYTASFRQARIRSMGSIIGGVYGVFIVNMYEMVLHNPIETSLISSLNLLTFYLLVAVAVVPLIYSTVIMKQTMATFVTVLTYLSITVSIRNNLPIEYFAVNRIFSTIFGVLVALMINGIHFNHIKNKDILFVSGLDGTLFIDNQELSGYTKHKLNHLIRHGANITVATTRTPSTLFQALNGVSFNLPLIIMKGAALYDIKKQEYLETKPICQDDRTILEYYFEKEKKSLFAYSVIDDVLSVFNGPIINLAEKYYYEQHKKDFYKNHITGLPDKDCQILLFMLIDIEEEIFRMAKEIRELNPDQTLDIQVYPFEGMYGYYFMRIYDHRSKKYEAIKELVAAYNFNKVVVLGSKVFDIPMMQSSDYSIALGSASNEVKSAADLVLKDTNPDAIVAQISKIFSMRHPERLKKKNEQIQ